MYSDKIKYFLDKKLEQYQSSFFIEEDPITIPHHYSLKQDIEIAGFFAALFAWGRRETVIKKATVLLSLMDQAPFDFITQHEEKDLKRFLKFVHRTFNATDILYFISFLKSFYHQHESLEEAFCKGNYSQEEHVEKNLNGFYQTIFEAEHPKRTEKHISAPFKKSACKRMNMYLRWMVRSGEKGIDFGLWKKMSPDQLVIPLDVHVCRVATRLGLISPNRKVNWETALALTEELKVFDPRDPVKYDLALFGLGAIEKFR